MNIKTKILRAIEDIRMVHMENQIQVHKDKLEKERQQNPNFEDKRVEPKKMSVWHVPVNNFLRVKIKIIFRKLTRILNNLI